MPWPSYLNSLTGEVRRIDDTRTAEAEKEAQADKKAFRRRAYSFRGWRRYACHTRRHEPPGSRRAALSLSVGEMPTISPEAATEPTEAPQRGRDLGWNASEEYIAVRMAMAEAEGEDTEGKALVILVIYNRTKSGKFPDTVKGVISQRNAFTSYSNGRYEAVKPDADCWAALDLIQETGWDESQGALYFEQTPEDGESTWHSRNLERLFIHGNHTFYTEKEAKDP